MSGTFCRKQAAGIAMALLLAIAGASSGLAQEVTKVGTTGAKFLNIPVGARAYGMGGAFVAVANDASALYWNPAGIARLAQNEALFGHASWLADMSFNYVGVVLPMGDIGVAGVSFASLTMADMERTTEEQPDGTGEFFSAGSFAVAGTYAHALTDWFSIGGSVKYVNEHIWNSSADALAIDVGTLFTTPFTGVKFGAGISNFGQKLQISGDDLLITKDISSNNGNNPNIPGELSTDKVDMPLALRIGFSYEPLSTDDQQLLLVADAMHPNDNSESISVGGEYSVYKRMLAVRVGYRNLGVKDSDERLTLGGGINASLEGNINLRFDYGYEMFGRLPNVHQFAIGIRY
jgi:long-subunit fatty acid transport protein